MAEPDPIIRLNAALEGRYRIEREVGAGGMATVYMADDLRHEREVALKLQDGKPVISDFGIALVVSKGGGDRITETGLSLDPGVTGMGERTDR